MRDFLIVGLTGPTGSGKSTVSKFFENSGFSVINADTVAHDVLKSDACKRQLSLAFGNDVISEDGEVNRRTLAAKAFSTPENTQLLNDITHPRIFLKTLEMCREFIDSGRNKILFDAPVLFESNSDIMCDAVVAVTAPKEIRIARLMNRDGLPRKAIEQRISAQKNDEFYIEKADFTVNGADALTAVEENIKGIIKKLNE